MTTMQTKYNGKRSASRLALGLLGCGLLAACAGTPAPAPEPEPKAAEATDTVEATARPTAEAAPQQREATRAEPQRVRKTARYVVKKGDTLWGIAERFLIDPWQWPDVWVANRQVANPHLIYPGDVLELRWMEGREEVADMRKLSPRIRREPLDKAIPTIPLDRIRDFLSGPRIVDKGALESAPYVVEFDEEHLIGPDRVGAYVKGLPEGQGDRWLVVHPGEDYVDPDSGEVLGQEAIPAADATLTRRASEVAVMRLSDSRRETRKGDVLIPRPIQGLSANFYPRAPETEVDARIISVFGGVTQIAQYDLVVLNRGSSDGLEAGHVLNVYSDSRAVKDPKRTFGKVQLPAEYAGNLLVVAVTDKLAQGLIMESERPILIHDQVHEPDREL